MESREVETQASRTGPGGQADLPVHCAHRASSPYTLSPAVAAGIEKPGKVWDTGRQRAHERASKWV